MGRLETVDVKRSTIEKAIVAAKGNNIVMNFNNQMSDNSSTSMSDNNNNDDDDDDDDDDDEEDEYDSYKDHDDDDCSRVDDDYGNDDSDDDCNNDPSSSLTSQRNSNAKGKWKKNQKDGGRDWGRQEDNDDLLHSDKQNDDKNWRWNLSTAASSDDENLHHSQQQQRIQQQQIQKEEEVSEDFPDHNNQFEKSNIRTLVASTKPVVVATAAVTITNDANRTHKNGSSDNKMNENIGGRRRKNRSGHRSSSNSSLELGANSSHHWSSSEKSIGHGSMNSSSSRRNRPSLSRNKSVERSSNNSDNNQRPSDSKSLLSRRKSNESGVSTRGESIRNNNNDRSSDSSKRRVNWKSDPKASFSDWTIEIEYCDEIHNQPHFDVYHIHKNITGFGNRKSQYLLREFQEEELRQVINNDYSNNNNNNSPITQIKLPAESQARAFPMVLDFLYYTKEIKKKLTAEMSCNIFKLSELLEIQALAKAIGEFYMKNLTLKNLGDFLTAATKFKADKLLTICKAKIGHMITERPELSKLVPPKFMADILWISRKQLDEARLKEPEKYTEELVISQSQYWSKAACICAAQHEGILTPKLFEQLTSSESLPYIDASATPKLLSIESNVLFNRSITINNSGHANEKKGQLTSLQQRCVESIAKDFDTFRNCFNSSQAVSDSLKDLPSNVLTEILLKSLSR